MNTTESVLFWGGIYLLGLGTTFTMYKILHSKSKIWGLLRSERGQAGETTETKEDANVKFNDEQQKVLDKIIDKKYATWKIEEKTKYGDYEELRKFKDEQLKLQDNKAQQELENQKKYEEAKKGYENKLTELSGVVSKKDQEIIDLRINHTLTNEINRQNGYTEETLALIKSQTSLDANGNVVMKVKDANGIEQTIQAVEGVKKLLESRPYLIRSTHKAGSGTGSGAGTSETLNNNVQDLTSLNSEYQRAFYSGDLKKANEVKAKIKNKMAERTAV